MKKTFNNLILILILGISSVNVTAQVKMGNNPGTINSNSILELESTNKGLLLPRLALTASNNVSPLSAHVAGMVVYNTATAGTAPNNVVPGYYFNTGSSWSLIASSSSFALPQTALSSSTSPAGTATGQLIYNTATVTGVAIGPAFWNGSSWVNVSSVLEPWYNVATTAPATSNTQNIYQMGNVGIGTSTPSTKFTVNGILSSTPQVNTTAGSSITSSVVITDANMILPSPVDKPGCIIFLRNISGFNNIIISTPAGGIFGQSNSSLGTSITLAPIGESKSAYFISDGFNWTYFGASDKTIGDIKSGYQSSDHGGWVKLDGRLKSTLTATQQAQATALGIGNNLPNANDAVLSQNGTSIGSVSGSNNKTIVRAQLPNFTLSGTTSTNGNHTHTITNHGWGSGPTNSNRPRTDQNSPANDWIGTTSFEGNHNHTFTTNSVNGNVTQQVFDVRGQQLSVNMYIYLGY